MMEVKKTEIVRMRACQFCCLKVCLSDSFSAINDMVYSSSPRKASYLIFEAGNILKIAIDEMEQGEMAVTFIISCLKQARSPKG